ncbi:MAG: CinA family nicotinamide mononucleotide deamidase-related protein [Bacteroidales bacterium]|nr:CinA family nicotinamide mononucleotide deamidase-related protein [Bacteroidales bacterium]
MLVELITIGDEILIGQIVDTNSAWMATVLNQEGFRIKQITSVSDDTDHILEAVDLAFKRADVVLVTGGLGPTKDDITKQTLCTYFNTELVYDTTVLENIQALFKDRPVVLNELTLNQAYVPKTATIIQNKRGTAPVTWFDKGDKVLVSMPGVPSEMQWVMSHEVLPRLKAHFKTPALMHRTVLVHGYPESGLAMTLTDWENNLPSWIKLAYLPSPGLVKLRLTGSLDKREDLAASLERELVSLRAILGKAILAEADIPVEAVVGQALKNHGLTLSTAESCTGGRIAHLLTSIPGSSAYFTGSVVAYDNRIKVEALGVDPASLETEGAVSQTVVEQMAAGIRQRFGTDLALAVSGIAGPDGGSPEKPVGTVWICACSGTETLSRRYQFGQNRSRTVDMAALSAMALLLEVINHTNQS